MYWKEVRDADLWKKIQLSFLEAMGIFVFTIFIGILNAIDLVDFTQAVYTGRIALPPSFRSDRLDFIECSNPACMVFYRRKRS
jgi:hypothetical protein